MKHVTVESLESLIQWLADRKNVCNEWAAEESKKGNTAIAHKLKDAAVTHEVTIFRLRVIIDAEVNE